MKKSLLSVGPKSKSYDGNYPNIFIFCSPLMTLLLQSCEYHILELQAEVEE